MAEEKFDWDRIEEEIKQLPVSAALALAGRAAWRVMPATAYLAEDDLKKDRKPFWFWENDVEKHLIAVDNAITITLRSASLTANFRVS
ncbi:MAG: hypothetical protein ACF8OB_00650, partial [Phycisphaeraceae bacterium JB051]